MIKIKNTIDFPDTSIYVVDVQDISLGEIANIKPHGNFENELQHSHISRTMKYLITLLINNKLEYKEEFSSINDRKGSSIMIKFTHILKINKQHFYLMIEKMIDEVYNGHTIESSIRYQRLSEKQLSDYPSQEELIEKWVVCEDPIQSAHLVMQLREVFIIKKRNEAKRVHRELLNRNANSSDFFNNVNSYVFIEDRNRTFKTPEKEEEEQVDSEERNLPIRKNVTATDFTELSKTKALLREQLDKEERLSKENPTRRMLELLAELRPIEQDLQAKRELLIDEVERLKKQVEQQEQEWFDKPYIPRNLMKEKYSLTVDPFEKELPVTKKSKSIIDNAEDFFEFLYYLFDSKGFWLLALIVATLVIISSLIFRHKH